MTGLDEIKNVLKELTNTTDNDLSALDKLCAIKHYKKGEFFLEPKTVPVYSGYIVGGAFREFYVDKNGREYNKAFCFKGDFTGSYYDLNTGKPSTVAIQALTDSKVLVMRHKKFEKLVHSDTFWLKVSYRVAHNLLMKKFEKEHQLLTLSAAERYDVLRKEHPELEQLVPAYHIASYLGITAESLSRIRAQKAK